MVATFVDLAPTAVWAEAAQRAPRHLFVPDVSWTVDEGLIDRGSGPETWWTAVHADDAIVTQIDDGNTELTDSSPWRHAHNWTSSCSAPSVVFAFLDLLEPYEGDRVLEIGTGTGWTAALLSACLGADNVTSIEVDEQVAKRAASNLERAGYTPHLIVGDGAEGWPDGGLYDRVHVTCGVRQVPYAWVEQTRPGGVIAVPWATPSGACLKGRLTVTGNEAVGRFCGGEVAYMMMRAQRRPLVPIESAGRVSTANVDPRRIDAAGVGLSVAIAGLLPGVEADDGVVNPMDGTFRMVVREFATDSHALVIQSSGGGAAEVTQRGGRNLWDELETAYTTWVSWGEPDIDRFGITIRRSGQRIWLGGPGNDLEELD